jgi:hypothetical protein
MQDVTTSSEKRGSGLGKSLGLLALLALVIGIDEQYLSGPAPNYPIYFGFVTADFIFFFVVGAIPFGIVRLVRRASGDRTAGLVSGIIAILVVTSLSLYGEYSRYLRQAPETAPITRPQG